MDSFLTHLCLRAPVPLAATASDLYYRLRINKAETLANPLRDIRFYGLPDNSLRRDHDLLIILQLPNHWAAAIIQPYENLITYYDGARGVYPGCAYSEVFPVLRDWLRNAYSALDLSDSQAVGPSAVHQLLPIRHMD